MIRHLTALSLLLAAPVLAQDSAQRVAWNRPTAPFRIVGNVFYVGTAGLSAFLIADPKGLILIDGGLPESAPHVAENVRRLGYRMRDVRYLLINHAHFDHAGGLAALKRDSGAVLVASAGDRPDLVAGRTIGRPELGAFPPVTPDRVVRDGETVRVGGAVLTANLTPGHTPGCTSWSMTTRDRGRPVSVLFACSLTVAGQKLVADGRETPTVGAFRSTFAKLRRMRADVFLNFHPEFFDLDAKRARLAAGNAGAFVDHAELPRQVAGAERAFIAELAKQRARPQS